MRPAYPYVNLISHPIAHVAVWSLIVLNGFLFFLSSQSLWKICLAVPVAYLCVDVLSGVIHWLSETLGVIFKGEGDYSRRAAYIILEHHTDVLNYSLISYSELAAFGYFPLLVGYPLTFLVTRGSFYHAILTFGFLYMPLIMISHRLAHEAGAGFPVHPVVHLFQRLNLLMRPQQHNRHHFYDSCRWFGFLCGLTDTLTNPIFYYLLPRYEVFDDDRKILMKKLLFLRKQTRAKTGSVYVTFVDECSAGEYWSKKLM